mgnify:CR=1 FL=1
MCYSDLAEDRGAQVALSHVHHPPGSHDDGVQDLAGPPKRYLVGGGAGYEVVVAFVETPFGDLFVFIDIYRVVAPWEFLQRIIDDEHLVIVIAQDCAGDCEASLKAGLGVVNRADAT